MKALLLVFAVALFCPLIAVGDDASAAADTPNIVFVIADDCTFRDIGCYGGQAITPNIDKLATQGMRFTRCFQAAPMCSPTRHNIYTGQYPVKSGAYPNHTHVEAGTQSVVQYLGDLGYRVAHSGKSHVGPASVFAWEEIPDKKNPDFARVDGFIAECESQKTPFCLLLCSNEPHSPWNKGDASQYPPREVQLPEYHVDTPETRRAMSNYLAEVTYFDGQVGEAMGLIEKHGLAENTLFIVVSEQGNSMPFAKWTCYDSGLQSAMIARWPGKIEPGSVNPAMIEYVDLLPTFVEAAGGDPAPVLDGKSLLPVFAGKQEHKQFVFGEMTTRGIINGSDYFGIRSVRSERYKYIWNFTPDVEFQNACTSSIEFRSWKAKADAGDQRAADLVMRYTRRPEVELYDVVEDPLEMNNLAENPEYATVMTQLRSELDQWMVRCSDRAQQTELEALEHMGAKRNARAKEGKGKKKKQQ
ncbi:sulfatase [Rhodopirellula sp. SWK7]|uniref:sulfatase family protein n=1 Tax=Rhodopirellula sp. SWK7 TaxID=595460 RepID=UPI0002BE64B2|nr:sulfatase [Rhodopirellula sp. SWK7]EMI45821.1 sulfatase atsG [Rhodopirellula sp. SWK7]